MKKFFDKKIIFGILIGIIITGAASIGATVLYNSNQVKYTPSNVTWDVTNVDEALNNLYNKMANSNKTFTLYNFPIAYTERGQAGHLNIDISKIKSITLKVLGGTNPNLIVYKSYGTTVYYGTSLSVGQIITINDFSELTSGTIDLGCYSGGTFITYFDITFEMK